MSQSTRFLKILGVLLAGLLFAGSAWAAEPDADAADFANHPLAGPQGTGSVVSDTYGDIMMSFGARMRVIPTSEGDWDFGFEEDLEGSGRKLVPNPATGEAGLDSAFFKQHANESGWVTENYIRTEAQIYFNTMPRDRKWSFHSALEFDRPVDTVVVDDRGGYNDETSEFGLERLHGSYRISDTMRFHAGYDIWFVGDPAGLTYGDDAPGFWVDGSYGDWDYNAAYFKLSENNWGTEPAADRISDSKNDDRDLYAGYTDYNISENRKIKGIYMFDRIRNVKAGTMRDALLRDAAKNIDDLESLGFESGSAIKLIDLPEQEPDTDSHYLGLVYEAESGPVNYFLEGIYQFGQADDTGLDENTLYPQGRDDYDISAFAFAGDLEIDLDDSVGLGFKPHLGFIYASGDDDPEDDELGGYTGVVSHQRFTKFGGENTIISDGNTMLGTVVYSYLPGLYGNGTPVVTGGLPNATSLGTSRGDNPGLTMTSAGITLEPRRFLIFKSNVNSFWWNEDIKVQSLADPSVVGMEPIPVDSGYVGTEWDNELTLALSRHTILKAQGALFFPGEVVEDVTSARSAVTTNPANPAAGDVVPGEESDEMAYRLGMEFIWMF